MWIVLHNRILTIDNLMKRGWTMVNRCNLCCRENESVFHLLVDCDFVNERILMNGSLFASSTLCGGAFAHGKVDKTLGENWLKDVLLVG
ncbi:unnamed protein product [Linum trigynum]|uniref:Reverse transcriptase zinc-binding domain-containing protein n=1 Tax=Linum trigynum TaxID=586398 RepID=A0AAV2EUL7_9ROSI